MLEIIFIAIHFMKKMTDFKLIEYKLYIILKFIFR